MTVRVVVGLDGAVHDPGAPLLAADDLAAVRGDGIFETLLVRDGVVREERAHLDRMARSAAALGLPEPDRDAWRRCIAMVRAQWARTAGAEAGAAPELVVRLLLSRGREGGSPPTGWATGSPVTPAVAAQREAGVSVLRLERGLPSDLASRAPWLLLGAKTLSYAVNMAALRHAAALGADDVIFTSTDGAVLEGPTSTVVVARGRELVTPPVETGILPGTTQQALFRAAGRAGFTCTVGRVEAAELTDVDAVWLLSSVRLLARVHTLDGVVLPRAEAAAALTAELSSLLA